MSEKDNMMDFSLNKSEIMEKYLNKVKCKKYILMEKNGVDEVLELEVNEDHLIKEKAYKLIIQDKEYETLTLDDENVKYLSFGQVYIFSDYSIDIIKKYNQVFDDYSNFLPDLNMNTEMVYRKEKLITNCENITSRPSELFTLFLSKCKLFELTGAVHNALFFSSDLKNQFFFFDLARHNCIIKGAGFILINDVKVDGVFLSCRVNTEILSLVDKIGISNVYTKASVTYDAIKYAEKNNIKLYGYVKYNRWTVFT